MLRTVLAVLIGAALLGLALPVVDDARVTHADSQVRTELDHLETAAVDLGSESDPVRPGVPGASVQHSLLLPTASWGKAAIERLVIPASANGSVRWRVAGGTTHRVRPSPPLVAPPDGLTIREPGRHRLTLSLQRRAGRQVVVVSRADV
jgi:hypothetical protein